MKLNFGSSEQMIQGDRSVRAAVARLTHAANHGDESTARSALREAVRLVALEKQIARRQFIDAILEDDEPRLLLNYIGRTLIDAPLSPEMRDFGQHLKRAIGEDGTGWVAEKIGSDLYDLLSLSGAWATLGVRTLRSKSTKFPKTTVLPTAVFVLTEGAAIPEDATLAGSSLSAEAELLGVLIHISFALWDDVNVDIAADLLEKFERACNARLDHACFNADGTADESNGGMTGIFPHADVASSVAAPGNTTVKGLSEEDWLTAFQALPPGAIQRGPAAWMHPTLLIKAMSIKSQGQRIVRTALESDTGGALFSVCGFPAHATAAAPSTDGAGRKIAAVGSPDSYLVGIRKAFTLESSGHYRWNQLQRTFRAYLRARGEMRESAGFITLKTAAI